MQYLEEDKIAKKLLVNLLMIENPITSMKLVKDNTRIKEITDNKYKKLGESVVRTLNKTTSIDEKRNEINSIHRDAVEGSSKLFAGYIAEKCSRDEILFQKVTSHLIENKNIHKFLNEAEYTKALVQYINERSVKREVSEEERSGAVKLLKIAKKQFLDMKTYNKNLIANSKMGNPYVSGKNLQFPSVNPTMFNTKEYEKVIESLELIITRGFMASLTRMFSTLPDPITIEFAMKQASAALSRKIQDEVGSLINIDVTKIDPKDAEILESLPLMAYHPSVFDKNFPEDVVEEPVRKQALVIRSKVKNAVSQVVKAIKALVKPPKELKWAVFGKLNVVSPAGIQFMSIKALHGEESQKFPPVPEVEQSQIDQAASIPVESFAEDVQVETEDRVKLGTIKLSDLGIEIDSTFGQHLKLGKGEDATGRSGWDLAMEEVGMMDDSIHGSVGDKVIAIVQDRLKDQPEKLASVVKELEGKKNIVGKEILQRFVTGKKGRKKGIGRYLGQKLNKIIGKAGGEEEINLFVETKTYRLSDAAWMIQEYFSNLEEQQN